MKIKLDSKLLIRQYLLGGLILTCWARLHGQERNIEAVMSGVRLEVKHRVSYPTSKGVTIGYTIKNQSDAPFVISHVGGEEDMIFQLTGPDGAKVKDFENIVKSRSHVEIQPGEGEGGTIDLAYYFPIAQIGEYRCNFTYRVYEAIAVTVKGLPWHRKGKPIDVTLPEFRFRVETIDPTYRSPLAPKLKEAKASDEPDAATANAPHPAPAIVPPLSNESKRAKAAHSQETTPKPVSTALLAWVIVALAVIGLAWLLLKKRK